MKLKLWRVRTHEYARNTHWDFVILADTKENAKKALNSRMVVESIKEVKPPFQNGEVLLGSEHGGYGVVWPKKEEQNEEDNPQKPEPPKPRFKIY